MAAAKADPRRLAWDVLREVERGGFADALLAAQLGRKVLDDRDRALTTRLVYGTIAWQGTCDHVLSALGRRAADLDPAIRTLLRMALFQLLELDRVPDFAAVDTAVRLSKRHRGGGASGLVNALLRRFLREGKDLQIPDDAAPATRLALLYSHPVWLVEAWIEQLGADECEQLLRANNTPAATVLRVNQKRATREQAVEALAPITARACSLSPTALECDLRGALGDSTAYRDGLVTPQGEASQLVGFTVPIGTATHILDAAAAPGGKATHLAERGAARVTALDVSHTGLVLLRRNARRLGLEVDTVCADARVPPLRDRSRFEAVLLDAPCSGFGTLRQHPEIRWRRRPSDIRDLARRQTAMLDAIADHVAPGGYLIYSTCTIARDENEARVESFLERHRDFVLDPPVDDLPETARGTVGNDGYLRTYPHRQGTDGFFAARMKRNR